MAAAGLKPTIVNGLRGTLHTVYSRARKAGVWTGPNLVKDVESRKVPHKVHATLRAEEVPLLLACVPDEWRTLFATALYIGMRKGELFGLRKRDVDLATGTLTIARSYDKETTKGGHADIIPIAKPLVPYLRAAMAAPPPTASHRFARIPLPSRYHRASPGKTKGAVPRISPRIPRPLNGRGDRI